MAKSFQSKINRSIGSNPKGVKPNNCCGMNVTTTDDLLIGTGGGSTPTEEEFILLEGGDFVLQEDSFKIKLETSV